VDNELKSHLTIQEQLCGIRATALQVITRPGEFFRTMPKSGGFLPPLTFMVALGLATGLVHTLLSLLRLSPGGTVTGLAALILVPIVVGVFGFIGAAILFIIWKLMGSGESYETAYRGMAYTAAILPITAVLGIIPYLGGLVGLLWMTFLIVVVSIEVHGIKPKTAWVGFGAICAFFAVTSLSAEYAGRKMVKGMEAWQKEHQSTLKQLEGLQDMTPEEAGKAMGEFLKGLQQAVEEKK
jgi:hypothetical protein